MTEIARLYGEITGHALDILTNIRNTPTTIRITQSDWLKVLKNMGYGDTLIFEIPIPNNSTSEIPEQILQYLRNAQKHYLTGNYNESISDCRIVFDKLEELFDDEAQISRAKNKYLTDRTSREAMFKEERALLIRSVIRHYTHLSHHPEEDEKGIKIPFSRNEAGMILGLTSSIVSFYFKESVQKITSK